jgi:hypothetical protein
LQRIHASEAPIVNADSAFSAIFGDNSRFNDLDTPANYSQRDAKAHRRHRASDLAKAGAARPSRIATRRSINLSN